MKAENNYGTSTKYEQKKKRFGILTPQGPDFEQQQQNEANQRMAELMEQLPFNGSDVSGKDGESSVLKRIRILWAAVAFIVYGVFIGGIVCFLFQKITSAFHGSDNYAAAFSFMFVLIGVVVFYFFSRSSLNRIKYCTVQAEGLIVSYQVDRVTDEYGRYQRTTYIPIYGYIYNGRKYTVQGHSSDSGISKLGKKVRLCIDPNEPTTYFMTGSEIQKIIFMIIYCTLFIGLGYFFVFLKVR